ncbi:MAG TPA: PepSY domain-containing protein [Elusimicrobiota bacterium]|nr:PepSY domain-containing protein [Elusimicrobiota bacterium]
MPALAAAPAKQSRRTHRTLPALTRAQATAALRAQVKGAKILEAELEKESGQLIWSFDVESASGIMEVWLNPHTGAVIKKQAESAAKEKQEMMGEHSGQQAAKKDERAEEMKERADKAADKAAAAQPVPTLNLAPGQVGAPPARPQPESQPQSKSGN